MWEILLGNLCSVGAMVSDAVSGMRKTTKGTLLVQCVSMLFYGLGSIILKGYSAAVQNLVGIARNLVAIRNQRSRAAEWLFIALPVLLGILFNNRGLLGLLPVAANLEYSVAMFAAKENTRVLKLAFIANHAMFGVFNAVIFNFVGACANAVVLISTVLSLLKKENEEKKS